MRIDHASEKLDAVSAWEDHIVAAVQIEGELAVEKCLHVRPTLYCHLPTADEDRKVIAVAQIVLDAENVLHVPIEFVQVDV